MAVCKSAGIAYVGSNPTPATSRKSSLTRGFSAAGPCCTGWKGSRSTSAQRLAQLTAPEHQKPADKGKLWSRFVRTELGDRSVPWLCPIRSRDTPRRASVCSTVVSGLRGCPGPRRRLRSFSSGGLAGRASASALDRAVHRRAADGEQLGQFERAVVGSWTEPPTLSRTPRLVSSSTMSRASGTEWASRSSFVTTRVSPSRQAARASRSLGRSRFVPVRPWST